MDVGGDAQPLALLGPGELASSAPRCVLERAHVLEAGSQARAAARCAVASRRESTAPARSTIVDRHADEADLERGLSPAMNVGVDVAQVAALFSAVRAVPERVQLSAGAIAMDEIVQYLAGDGRCGAPTSRWKAGLKKVIWPSGIEPADPVAGRAQDSSRCSSARRRSGASGARR